MGSSEIVQHVARDLELVQLQLRAQSEWAQQALESAHDAMRHFTKLADSYGTDCAEAMKARASATRFSYAAQVFNEVLTSCQVAVAHAEREMSR
jgi:hypothetical protein